MRQGIGFLDAPTALADHDGHFAFVVELVGFQGFEQRRQVADLARGEAREERGLFRERATGFSDVIQVVQAHADDLAGIGDRGEQLGAFERQIGGQRSQQRRNRRQGPGRQQLAQALETGVFGQIDDAIALDHAKGGTPVDHKRN